MECRSSSNANSYFVTFLILGTVRQKIIALTDYKAGLCGYSLRKSIHPAGTSNSFWYLSPFSQFFFQTNKSKSIKFDSFSTILFGICQFGTFSIILKRKKTRKSEMIALWC
ncbi:hypothetical protein [Candidatus Uabimicrobium sp. HlEnr_7]|uniref:hypothetical protein n=1 Tax=Candidatus Uabimicrobium helgolandensis TaxID=3095367 RepID=UPI003557457B